MMDASPTLRSFWNRCLKSVRYVGRHERPVLLLILFVSFASWGFAEIADEVMEGETMGVDERVLLALSAIFLAYIGAVAALVIAHNALALGGGYVTATLARVSAFDRRAITIETGIQNSGLGLILIFAFFNGLGGMAVAAAFWGIWHAISGLGLAWMMARTEASR